MANPYARALEKLASLTETKNLVLANLTGYDISYISKWRSGKKVPTAKHIDRINGQLAQYFGPLLQERRQGIDFQRLYDQAKDAPNLTEAVAAFLRGAYDQATAPRDPMAPTAPSTYQLITGHHDTAKFLERTLMERLGHCQGEGNLLVLGEFCTLYDLGFWKYVEAAPMRAKRCTIRVGLDVDKLVSDTTYTHHLYTLLNRLLNYDFIFYDYRHVAHTNMIILEHEFALQYSLESPDAMGLCTYIPDTATVDDLYQRFLLRFTSHDPIFAPSRLLGIDAMGFRTAFYSVSNFFFFLTNGFDFLLPSEAIDEFLHSIDASDQVVRQVSHLRIIWEELLSTVNVEFLLPTTSIIRYIETGYMFFTDAEFHMNGPGRKAHLKNIIATMRKNPRIKMGVFPSSSQTTEYHESNLSFYSNFSSAFFKKNPQFITNDASPIYVVSSTKLVNAFHLFFYTLKELPTYHQYTYSEINEKYEKYKTFIERTIDLHSDLDQKKDIPG